MAEYTGAAASEGSPGNMRSSTGGGNGIVGRVREQASSQLNTQKNKATEGLGSIATAVRQTTGRLREDRHETVAQYVEQAADQIERISERLKNKDVGDLLTDAQRLARRQPALFVGGAFAVGLLGARFLKSSARDEYSPASSTERMRGVSESYTRSTAASSAGTSGIAPGQTIPGRGGTSGEL